ncbi:MAG: cytochrome b [Hyphomicrobium sp.]|nr:cytochrome b [Hyphomicrobium sp.]
MKAGHTLTPTGTAARYPAPILVIHWLTLVLIVVSYIAMEAHEAFPRGSEARALAIWAHYQTGLSVLVLTFARIAFRLATHPAPPIIPAPAKWQATASHAVHFGIYALLIAMPFIGWALQSADGKAVALLGVPLPALVEPSKILSGQLEEVHETLGNALYVLIFVHAAAALAHHFVVRDNTMKRMLPG